MSLLGGAGRRRCALATGPAAACCSVVDDSGQQCPVTKWVGLHYEHAHARDSWAEPSSLPLGPARGRSTRTLETFLNLAHGSRPTDVRASAKDKACLLIPDRRHWAARQRRHEPETTLLSAVLLRLFGIVGESQMRACRLDFVAVTPARRRQISALRCAWHAPCLTRGEQRHPTFREMHRSTIPDWFERKTHPGVRTPLTASTATCVNRVSSALTLRAEFTRIGFELTRRAVPSAKPAPLDAGRQMPHVTWLELRRSSHPQSTCEREHSRCTA